MLDNIGKWIARYLQQPASGFEPFTPSDPEHLRGMLTPGDVLLVEGNSRIAGMIKYLTQSTWSHAALYVGPIAGATEPDGEPHVLIEAEAGMGVSTMPLSKYFPFHTRICRPVGLSYVDRVTVCRYAINRVGFGYDTKNIVDLARYLVPLPVPQRFRRRMISLGSGDPTKMICSTLIAQAFGAVRYPILPTITRAGSRRARREILHIRDTSLYMPRDFDISPYFDIIKPTIASGFDYTALHWADTPKHPHNDKDAFPISAGAPPVLAHNISDFSDIEHIPTASPGSGDTPASATATPEDAPRTEGETVTPAQSGD